ncbi:MAG: MBL fold metallo-hydrolase [bacterium]|nr:MBL fold metallo-hydrolase [bacterium]
MLQVLSFPVGALMANCHVLFNAATMNGVVIDPGDEGPRIEAILKEDGITPVMILNTHGHGDHIGANAHLKKTYGVPIMIHEGDAGMLTDPEANLSIFIGLEIVSPPADRILQDGDKIEFEEWTLAVLHTPGHSPGGVSFFVEDRLFSGDALFKGSIGRSDLPGASHETLMASLRDKLMTLPDEVVVYPGHGPNTTIGDERRENPFLI